MKRLLSAIGLVVMAAGCGGSDGTAPPTVGPAEVRVITALAVYNTAADRDDLTVRLHNYGGPGTYYLEFWGRPASLGGPNRIRQEEPVSAPTAYDETVTYSVFGMSDVQAVKVKTRPINSETYTQTGCKQVRGDGGYCP